MNSFPQQTPDWNNLGVIHRNVLPARASFFNYTSPEKALTYDENVTEKVSLNGVWKFHHAASPFEAPEGFILPTFDASGWNDLPVPSSWQLEGYGGPQYLNKQYGIPVDQPNVPFEDNQTGSYIRRFTIPTAFQGRQLRLRFEGVDSAFHCWLNGTEVGYSQGARNPTEFDVTHLARTEGENILCVRVYQYCDGSYIEGQDQWRLSGIFRDVNLVAFPQNHIQDFHVRTRFDDQYVDADLEVTLELSPGVPASSEVSVQLFDETKTAIIVQATESVQPAMPEQTISIPVRGPKHWTAETPNLYHLVLRFGEQVLSQRVGFRQVEMKNGLLVVNGKRVLFKGANRHEHHPRSGRTVPYALLRQDLLMMKQHNLNALRTCHQPSDPRLYDLADELGIWVMDEADLECHGYDTIEVRNLSQTERLLTAQEQHDLAFSRAGEWISDNLDWQEAYLDRAKQLVSRDKNHPCVVIWSLGNEAFQGRNFQAMYDWIKSYDPTRPIHYEADIKARIVDVVSTMYPSLDKVKAFAENWDGKKPLFLVEFMHAMGNGPGNIKEYFDLFYEYPCLQGGWAWEWANHGLLTRNKEGKEYFGYGGDFGETHHDGHFIMDGLLTSDHQPGPGLLEYRKVVEPVQMVPEASSIRFVRIINRYDFRDLSHLKCTYQIVGDGFHVAGDEIPLPTVRPGEEADLDIPVLPLDKIPEGKDAFLELNFAVKEDDLCWERGEEVAWLQVPIHSAANADDQPPLFHAEIKNSPVQIAKTSQTVLDIQSTNSRWAFDLVRGQVTSWTAGTRNILHAGPVLTLWRAPTDNDVSVLQDWTEKEVKHARPYTREVSWSVDESANRAVVQCTQRVAPIPLEWAINTTTTYTFSDNSLLIKVEGKPRGRNLPQTLPRLGLTLALPHEFTEATWFGRGPGESYRDKKHAQRFGLYSSDVSQLSMDYEYPQESGNRTNTRWVRFHTADATSALEARFIDRPEGFDYQASHLQAEDVEQAKHIYELDPFRRPEVIVRLDADHHGLGSESCGPPALPEYTLKLEPFEFSVLLTAE
ncbi:glycosyl hydrolases family 2, TIM barrel domain-containing protein [Aspergillus cavernicola]|uniref:beta-galactosidase n=1 Tax=Aspergillus cavernicola TaxID=176166 RepID=A0ABR4ISG4_9EURO